MYIRFSHGSIHFVHILTLHNFQDQINICGQPLHLTREMSTLRQNCDNDSLHTTSIKELLATHEQKRFGHKMIIIHVLYLYMYMYF